MAFSTNFKAVNSAFLQIGKSIELAEGTERKKAQLDFKTEKLSLDKIIDGDTVLITNPDGTTRKMRLANGGTGRSLDTYETFKDLETMDPEMRVRMESKLLRQRGALARERGVDLDDVTNENVFEQGEKGRAALYQSLLDGQNPEDLGGPHDTSPLFEYADLGTEGKYKRALGLTRNRSGVISNLALNTPELNAAYGSDYNAVGRQAYSQAIEEQERAAAKRRAETGLSDEFAATGVGAVVDTTGRLAAGAQHVIGMVADLPLAGIEWMADGLEPNPELEGTDGYNELVHNITQFKKQTKENRSAVAKLFEGGTKFWKSFTNDKKVEETMASLEKAWDHDRFASDFAGILVENPHATLQFLGESIPFMYTAAKKGAALPFGAAFTGENYKAGVELYEATYDKAPETEEKALILAGAGFIAAMNSAASKYVTGEEGMKIMLRKLGFKGMNSFMTQTAAKLGANIPAGRLKSMSEMLLKTSVTALTPAAQLATRGAVEFVQEGSESLITKGSVFRDFSQTFTDSNLKEAAVSGAIGFGTGATAGPTFQAAGVVKLAGIVGKQTVEKGVKAAENIPFNRDVANFRVDQGDEVVSGGTAESLLREINEEFAVFESEAEANELANNPQEFERRSAQLMAKTMDLATHLQKMDKKTRAKNPEMQEAVNKVVSAINLQSAADANAKVEQIENLLASENVDEQQQGIDRVLGSSEEALSVSTETIDKAIEVSPNESVTQQLNEIKRKKTLEEVAEDVLRGKPGSGFIGVKNRQYIAERLLKSGDIDGANEQLAEIRRFREVHGEKATTLINAQKQFKETGRGQTVEIGGQNFFVDARSKKLINQVRAEVFALNEVGMALKKTIADAQVNTPEVEETQSETEETQIETPVTAPAAVQGLVVPTASDISTQLKEARKGSTDALKRLQEQAEVLAQAGNKKVAKKITDSIKKIEEAATAEREAAEQEAADEAINDSIPDSGIQNELELKRGDYELLDVLETSKSNKRTPLDVPASNKLIQAFNFTRVTLSTFFSRSAKSKANEAQEPIDETDAEHLELLNEQFKKYRNIAKRLPKLVGKELKALQTFTNKQGKQVKAGGHGDDIMMDMAALLLETDKDGNLMLPDDVILASFMGAMNWMTHQSKATLWNDDKLINQQLSQAPNSTLTSEQKRLMRERGSKRDFVAKTIGTDIFNSLALKADTSQPLAREKMIMSLGLFATKVMSAMEEDGDKWLTEDSVLLENLANVSKSSEKVQEKASQVFFMRISPDSKNNLQEAPGLTKVIDQFSAAMPTARKLFNLENYERKPRSKPSKKVNDAPRGNLFKAGATALARVLHLQQVPWTMNATGDLTAKLSDGLLKSISGYTEDVATTVHITQQGAVAAVNRQIDDGIKYAKEMREALEDPASGFENGELFFDYEIWSNSRVGMTSNTFDPQNSKYHRHIVSPKSHKTTVNSKRRLANFKRGIALAFDYSDKGAADDFKTGAQLEGTLSSVEEEFDRIIHDPKVRAAISAIREVQAQEGAASEAQERIILSAVGDSDTKFHGLEALVELSSALGTRFGLKKSFTTTLSVETDGVTSGVTLGLMQAPIVNNIQTWLARGGIFLNGNFTNLGDAREAIPTDSYQQLVLDAVKMLEQVNPAGLEQVEAILGKLTEDGAVTSVGRNLMKNPLMVYSYGAGEFAIKRHMAGAIQTALYEKLAETNGDKEAMDELSQTVSALMRQNVVFEDHLTSEFSKSEQEAFDKAIYDSIGDATVSSLDHNFKEMADQRKVLLQALSISFHTFEMKYIEAVQKYKDSNGITSQFLSKEQKKEVLNRPDVKPFIPYFNSPYGTKNRESAVSILAEEIVRGIINDENRGASFFTPTVSNRIPSYTSDTSGSQVGQSGQSSSALVKNKRYRVDGVAALPKMIHTLDSTLILDTLNKFDGLNIHDAGMYSVDSVDNATKLYNQKVFETGRNYSLIGDITQMVTNQTSKLTEEEKVKVLEGTIAEEDARIKNEESKQDINTDTTDFDDRIKFLNKISQDIQAAKENLFESISHVHQAAYPSQSSVYSTGQEKEYSPMWIDFEYHPGEYDAVEIPMQTREEYSEGVLQSSQDSLSNFEASYENEATAETSQQIFDVLSKFGHVRENGQHQRHLRGILDTIINKALKPAQEFIIQVGDDAKARNVGQISGKTIQIQLGKYRPDLSLNQSAEEIYIHELLHGITANELDSNFALRQKLAKLFETAKKHITPADLITPAVTQTRTVMMDHVEALAAQARYDYIFNNRNATGGSDGLHEFLAFGLSNETFVKKLATIPFKVPREKATNVFEALINLFHKIFEAVASKYHGKVNVGSDVYSQLLDLTKDLTAINEGWRFPMSGMFGAINDRKQSFENSVYSKGDALRKKLNTMIDADRSAVHRKMFTLVNTLKAVSHEKFGKTLIQWLQDHTEGDSFMGVLWRELAGGSEHFRNWLPLLRYSKQRIDTARLAAKQNIIRILGETFVEEATDEEKEMLHDALLKTDLAALLPQNPTNRDIREIMKLFSDPAEIDAAINEIMKKIGNVKQKTYYQKQANNLGYFMATGNNSLEHANLNAYNIARLSLTDRVNNDLATTDTVALIDQLASLYAIKYTSSDAKVLFTEYVTRTLATDSKTNAIRLILNLQADHKDFTRDNLFKDEAHSVIKGFTNELIDQNIAVKVGKVSDEAILAKQGFKIAFKMDSLADGEKMAFYTAMNGAATTYTRTIFSTTAENVKGTTLTAAFMNDNPLVGRSEAKLAQNALRKQAMENMNKQFTGKVPDLSQRSTRQRNPLIPLVNAKGESYEYRQILNHQMRKEHLNEDRRIDEVLGAMYGAMKDKLNTRKNNQIVIENLYKDYQDNYDNEPDQFVRVGVNGDYGDVWAVIPEQSKEHIRSLTGVREIYIRAEVVDLVMGYRKFSLSDTKMAKRVLPPQVRHIMDISGKVWQEIVALGAVQIVVKTPQVLVDNVLSNTIILIRDGLNPTDIVRRHLEGIAALNQYELDISEEQKLVLELQQDANNHRKVAKLAKVRESIKRNPVTELVTEGIFQSITEDINVNKYTSASTIANTRVGKAVQNNMPGFMTPIFQHVFMTKDTYLFKQFLKATQYSDFLARYTRYAFLKEKEGLDQLEGDAYRLKKNEILADLIEDYVNYDVPQHKMLQYANDMGMVRFTKYFLRTQRVIVKKWKQQPINNMASVWLQQVVGDQPDINDSFMPFMSPMDKVSIFDVISDATDPKGLELAGGLFGL